MNRYGIKKTSDCAADKIPETEKLDYVVLNGSEVDEEASAAGDLPGDAERATAGTNGSTKVDATDVGRGESSWFPKISFAS